MSDQFEIRAQQAIALDIRADDVRSTRIIQGIVTALRTVHTNGLAEGRRQGLEEALKAVENGNCFVAADIIRVLIEESKA